MEIFAKKGKPRGVPFKKGKPGGPGRPKETMEQRVAKQEIRRFVRQRAATFLEACDALLPKAIDRVDELLERKGARHQDAHLRALEKLGDRVLGKPPQAITGAGGGPLVVSFQQILAGVDGAKDEKI